MFSRRSLSPEAVYHAIPQTPVAIATIPDIELHGEDYLDEEPAQPESTSAAPPLDKRIQWVHFVLGCSVLLPWNVTITAVPYFLSRLADSSLATTFSSYLSVSFTVAGFASLTHATITAKQSSPSRRILVATLCLSFLTFLLMLSTYIHVSPGFFFTFVLLDAVAQAGTGSYLQISVAAMASLFGPMAIQAVMSGQAAVAVVVSGVQVLSAVASIWGQSQGTTVTVADKGDGKAEEKSAFVFFFLSTVFLMASVGAHAWLVKLPAYKAVIVPFDQPKVLGSLALADTTPEGQESFLSRGRGRDEKGRILRVARANLVYEIAVAYVFVVTLSVFPPITASIQSTNPDTHPLLFTGVHFLVFNVGDFGGRYACSFPRLRTWSARRLLTLSVARTLFVPLFLMCNIQVSSLSPRSSPIISSDFLFMLILLAFGLSNGYVCSSCMMAAPSLENNPSLKGQKDDVDVAATVASFCLVGGLALGSAASFAVRATVCGCNPFIQ